MLPNRTVLFAQIFGTAKLARRVIAEDILITLGILMGIVILESSIHAEFVDIDKIVGIDIYDKSGYVYVVQNRKIQEIPPGICLKKL